MNHSLSFIGVVVILVCYSQITIASEEECVEWCRSNPECEKCTSWSGCGTGYENFNSFTTGYNWYACRINSNGRRCEEWCRNNEGCVMCSTRADCGPGYADMEGGEFRGAGGNWFACRVRASQFGGNTEQNRSACEEFCADREQCVFCSTYSDCGPGYENWPGRSWTGEGANYHACVTRESYQQASALNLEECREFCERSELCDHCSDKRYCGRGYTNCYMPEFRGFGKNWFACREGRGTACLSSGGGGTDWYSYDWWED